ncbi:MAG: DUF4012 domain-containing protein, partial [Thermodesulfovibrionia bacterium]|nr:DUF4012 domain-containing protein [Thermodesulfovibrionia bacterium]
TELRPTGGFIGTYGILKMRDGQVVDFMTDDVYNLDRQSNPKTRPVTPLPMQKYLSQKLWYLRDVNWSPDFKEAAQLAVRFYHEEGGKEKNIDGVIAITPEIISSLLKIVGPLTVGQQTFTAQNLVDLLEWQVEVAYAQQGIAKQERKGIISGLAYKLMENLHNVPLERWPGIIHEIKQDLDEKHILIYSNSDSLQAFLEARNWAGRLALFGGDYLMAIDANLAALKTDLVMKRQMTYELVKKNNGDLIATAKIYYTNQGESINWRTTRYRTYTRLYVPLNSVLMSSRGAMIKEKDARPGEVDIGEELGKTFFGVFIAIEPGETKVLEFQYKLPRAIQNLLAQNAYQLLIQKQAGVQERDLTISLNLGKKIQGWYPTGFNVKANQNNVVWRTKLRADQLFGVRF